MRGTKVGVAASDIGQLLEVWLSKTVQQFTLSMRHYSSFVCITLYAILEELVRQTLSSNTMQLEIQKVRCLAIAHLTYFQFAFKCSS